MHKISGLCAILATRPEPAAVASVLARMAPWLARRRMNGKAIVADYGGRTRILESTAHAGADGTRFLLTGSNGLLSSVDQGCWLAFDGEIYNRAELCQQLGAPYLTHITNAGLVLAAYERWGVECVSRFNGAWAFLLLDLRHGKLIGSRDHLGIKPLYFGERNGHLVFADDARAVALGCSEGLEFDGARVSEFLRGLPPRSLGSTFYRDIRAIPPACVFEVAMSDARPEGQFRTFWRLTADPAQSRRRVSFADAQEEFLHLLEDSIRLRIPRTGGFGCLLSGGLDSSLISRLLIERVRLTDIPTYSLVYSDPQSSDWPRIQAVLRQGGLRSSTMMPTGETLWAAAEEVIGIQGAPLLGFDLIAHWQLLKRVAESDCGVVLDGGGADEVLGATMSQQFALLWDELRGLQLFRLARELHAAAQRESWRAALGHLLGPCRTQWRLKHSWNTYDWLAPTEGPARGPRAPSATGLTAVQRAVRLQVCEQNVATVLAYAAQSAAAAEVSIRRPYLDHRLVEYCFGLPSEYRAEIGVRKRILREAAKRYLPPELFASPSRPFMDSERWASMLRQHGDALREMAGARIMAQLPMINAVNMRRFVNDYLAAKHDDGAAVWRLYTTWRWLESLRALRTRSPQAGSQPSASWAKLMPTVLKPLST